MTQGGEPHILIGIAGRMASGKGSVSQYLATKYGAERHRSSEPLRAIVDIFNIPQSRANLSDLSTFLRETYGEHTIAQAMLKVMTAAQAPIAVFDGMRRLIDIQTFRPLSNFTFVFVDCDDRIRYQRYISRNENPGDAEMSWDDFKLRDSAETECQIDELKQYADVVIDNSKTYEYLLAETKVLIDRLSIPTL